LAEDNNYKARIDIETNARPAKSDLQKLNEEMEYSNKLIDKNTAAQKRNLKATLDVNAGWRESINRHRNFRMMIGETEQASSRVYRNVATSMDAIIAERERVGQNFSDSLRARLMEEQKYGRQTQQSSRLYLNESTKLDAAIEARRKESEQFARGLRERLQLEQQQINQLPRLRYALYDVANAVGAVSVAFGAATFGAIKLSADFETAFTGIQRTTLATGDSLNLIREQLLALSRQVPVSFTELAGIATIGAQLGIASTDLAGFTKNVSMFAATTNVSVEEASKSFGALGELLNVPTSEFNKLGSAIAFVGVNSVATETEILSVAKNLGGVANQAGLSAEFVVGLSGALASLRVPAEQSRGALTRVFQEINRSTIEGGDKLQAFADVLGVTAAQAKELASTNQQAFFQQLLQGLSALNSEQLTAALDALSLSDIRVTNTLTRLSKNLDVVNASLGDSEKAYESGTFLAQAYGFRVEDLASRFQIFQNSLSEVGVAFGDAISPALIGILDAISKSLNGLADALQTDAGKAFAAVTITTLGFVAAVGSIISTSLLATAGLTAIKTAMVTAGWAEATVGAKAVTAALFGVQNAALAGSAGVAKLKVALISTGIGAAVVALGTLAAAFYQTATSAEDTFNRYVTDTSGLTEAIAADTEAFKAARLAGDKEAMDSYFALTATMGEASADQIAYQENLRDTADVLGVVMPNAIGASNLAVQADTRYIGENTIAWLKNALIKNEAFQDLINTSIASGQTVGSILSQTSFKFDEFTRIVAKQGAEAGNAYILNLVNGISLGGRGGQLSVLPAAFQEITNIVSGYTGVLKFLGLETNDATSSTNDFADGFENLGNQIGATSEQIRTLVDYANDLSSTFQRAFDIRWQSALAADDLVEAWEELGQRITDARNRILGLTATRDRLQYFLSIAIAAGDTLRINELQAELAENAEEVAEATDDASTELAGNSAAARRNRAALTALLQTNAAYITSLASSGASLEFIRSEINRLNQEFLAQGMALGYSATDLQEYSATFGDLTTIINAVPRDITVSASTNPALQALNEFKAKAESILGGGITYPVTIDPETAAQIKALKVIRQGMTDRQAYFRSIGEREAANALQAQINLITTEIGSLSNLWTGGYTGRGGKYEPAGIVHKGEYVIPKSMVNQSTGLPHADALGRLVGGSAPAAPTGYANGGLVTGGMMVSLSPDDRNLLRSIGASGDIVVAVDSREIARANARGAKLVTSEGGYLV
jgi:TP901 family phage tail tape measure protein